MITCAYHCHEIGGPFIAENPECPIHGSGGNPDLEEGFEEKLLALSDELERLEEALDKLSQRSLQ